MIDKQRVLSGIVAILRSQIVVHLLMIFSMICLSLYFIFSKFAFQEMHPVHFAAVRSVISTIIIVAVCLIVDRHFVFEYRANTTNKLLQKIPALRDHVILFVLALLLVPLNQLVRSNFLIFTIKLALAGLYFTDPIVAGVVQPINVVFTAIISILLKNEGISVLKIVGIVLSVLGAIAIVLIKGLASTEDVSVNFDVYGVIGTVSFLVSGFSFAVYLNIQRYLFNRGLPPFTGMFFLTNMANKIVTMWVYIYGTLQIGIIALCFLAVTTGGPVSYLTWLAALYGGTLAGGIFFLIGSYANRRVAPTIVSTYYTSLPILSAIMSIIFYNQYISWYAILACVPIVIGVFMVAYAKYKEQQTAVPQAEPGFQKIATASPISDVPDELEMVSPISGAQPDDNFSFKVNIVKQELEGKTDFLTKEDDQSVNAVPS
jgi:drug/metabolite transporter (DMT)-like permease